MVCPRCQTDLPEVAHYCHRCGKDERTEDEKRRRSFAVKPDEPVASFALVSSIMPRGAGQRPQTYRLALTIALVVALVAAIFGALPIAVLVAAFAVPIVYIVYIYDLNLWEDEPVPVTVLAFLATGAMTVVFTILWTWLRGPVFNVSGSLDGQGSSSPTLGTFLLVALLVPVVGEAIRQVGPVLLASRPEFDDLMDGFTFGVVSGVAYSCFDTIVQRWDLLTGGMAAQDPGLWVSVVFLDGLVKPLIFGTATGIGCAEFSGLGRGYDGFTARYYRGLAEAIVAIIAYQAGAYLLAFVPTSTMSVWLTLGWGLLILGVLLLRVRQVLHTGLMEAALERTARDRGVGDQGELQFCAACEMPLLTHAAFCNACGTAVRVHAKPHGIPLVQNPTAEESSASPPGASAMAAPTGDTLVAERADQAAASAENTDTGASAADRSDDSAADEEGRS